MPNLPDAPVILAGDVFTLELITDYETKSPSGAKVGILAGGGASIVKLNQAQLQQLAPVAGDRVAWVVKNSPWSMEGNRSGMSTQYVRNANAGDLDLVNSIINAGASATK